MAQTVLITLTAAGSDTGPFDLYSNADGYVTPFENNIAKATLEAGYTSVVVPDGATIIRVQSDNSICENFTDLNIITTTTTTSSTSTTTTTSTSSTTTTSTSTSSTTTTTTTVNCGECWNIQNESGVQTAIIDYIDCLGDPAQTTLLPGAQEFLCSPTIPTCASGCELISIIQDTGGNCEPECPSLG